jgi:hypothetical protein
MKFHRNHQAKYRERKRGVVDPDRTRSPESAYDLLSPIEAVSWDTGLTALAQSISDDALLAVDPSPFLRGWTDRRAQAVPELPALAPGGAERRRDRVARRSFSGV